MAKTTNIGRRYVRIIHRGIFLGLGRIRRLPADSGRIADNSSVYAGNPGLPQVAALAKFADNSAQYCRPKSAADAPPNARIIRPNFGGLSHIHGFWAEFDAGFRGSDIALIWRMPPIFIIRRLESADNAAQFWMS